MIKIFCSNKNLPEKQYLFDVTFNEFLGIEYELIVQEVHDNYIIELPNTNKVIIEDHFWNRIGNEELSYLASQFLPKQIDYAYNQFTSENDLPVLYGNPNIKVENKLVICSIDIFATIYFFLTRWEEYISIDRDFAGRFKYSNSISSKFNIIQRPIVNEYIEFLWNIFIFLGFNNRRRELAYQSIITHDIDQPIRLGSFKMFIKDFGKNLVKYKNFYGAINSVGLYLINKITPKHDLANCYDFLMDMSESINTKSIFNFQNSKKTKYDWGYNIKSDFVQNIFKRIKSRGHIIGYHPGFFTLDNPELWKQEYEELCNQSGYKVLYGRQHYLRFNVPYTWQIWEDKGLETDSTLGYSEKEGFRCGTCWQFSVYNFVTRKKLRLKETPLILMEVSLINYQKVNDPEIFFEKFKLIVNKVKKYKGNFVFLWHNSAFDKTFYTQEFYKKLINYLNT
jgi:hypothetical protein